MNRKALWWVVLAAALAAGIWGWTAYTPRQAKAPSAKPLAEPVIELAAADLAHVEPRELLQTVPLSGSLRAVNAAMVRVRVPGELQGLTVREGDSVRAGQELARIDPTESRARLQQAREQADAARAQIDLAQRQFDNNRALVDQGFISRTALEASQSNLAAAQANHKATLATLELARKSLDDSVLRAPIAGVVSQRLAQPGERLAVDARVVEIVDPRQLELEATLTAADSARLRVGQVAVLDVEGAPGRITARVARINPSAQAGSRSVVAYLSVQAQAGLRQGLFAQGQVETARVRALAVPLSAVRNDKPSPYVQLIEAERVVHRAVQAGVRSSHEGETLVAVEGLAAGALVLRGHVGALREGTRVKLSGAGGAPAQAPASSPAASPRALPGAAAATAPAPTLTAKD